VAQLFPVGPHPFQELDQLAPLLVITGFAEQQGVGHGPHLGDGFHQHGEVIDHHVHGVIAIQIRVQDQVGGISHLGHQFNDAVHQLVVPGHGLLRAQAGQVRFEALPFAAQFRQLVRTVEQGAVLLVQLGKFAEFLILRRAGLIQAGTGALVAQQQGIGFRPVALGFLEQLAQGLVIDQPLLFLDAKVDLLLHLAEEEDPGDYHRQHGQQANQGEFDAQAAIGQKTFRHNFILFKLAPQRRQPIPCPGWTSAAQYPSRSTSDFPPWPAPECTGYRNSQKNPEPGESGR